MQQSPERFDSNKSRAAVGSSRDAERNQALLLRNCDNELTGFVNSGARRSASLGYEELIS